MVIDATGISLIIGALTALIMAVGGLYIQLLTFRSEQKVQNAKLDGNLTEMLKSIKQGAAAEAIIENDKVRAVLQAAVTKAVHEEREHSREVAVALATPTPEDPLNVRIAGQNEPVPVVMKDK